MENKKARFVRRILAALCLIVFMGYLHFPIDADANSGSDSAVSTGGQTTEESACPYEESDGILEAATKGTFWIDAIGNGKYRFVNAAHGYAFVFTNTKDSFLNASDMSNSSVVSVLEDNHKRIEIYKEGYSDHQGYLNYGYTFFNKETDLTVDLKTNYELNGRMVYVKQWHRDKLSGIENDHNYYASIDFDDGKSIYNMFITADVPFSKCGGYIEYVNSFFTFAPTAKSNDIVKQRVEKSVWNAETKEYYDKHFLSSDDLEWGIYQPSAPFYFKPLYDTENLLDFKFNVILVYSSISEKYSSYYVGDALEKAHEDGRIVELTLQTPLKTQGRNMIYDVLDGKYDSFLHDYAKDVAKFKHPVLFRPFNEMNGEWCNYSSFGTSRDTIIYKELYRYVYSIFEEEGALANTIWIWNPNGVSYPKYTWNSASCYYPGDEYVDVVGLTRYNTGNYYSGEIWRTFSDCYDAIYRNMNIKYSQPMMITEFACSGIGGNKPLWVADMFENIKKYSNVKIAIWWDACDFDANGTPARTYYIDDSNEVIKVFKDNLSAYKKNEQK